MRVAPPFPPTHEPQPLRSLLLLFGFVALGMVLGAVALTLFFRLAATLPGGPPADVTAFVQQPATTPNGWWWLILVQMVSHVTLFLVPTLLYWFYVDHRRLTDFSPRPAGQVAGWGLIVLLTIAFMPANGLFIELNKALRLPDTLGPVEQWMRAQEDSRLGQTKFMTTFQTVPQLLMALFTIGLVAAVGEELLFRGVLQRKFIAWTGSVHGGVWLAAALFSAIHLQFYGFLPRMLLGAVFGYLYVWSGNLWAPILAHFTNNGFTVLLVFLYQRGNISLDVEGTESVSPVAALVGTLLTVSALRWFKRLNTSPPPRCRTT